MFSVIHCTECGKEGALPTVINFTVKSDTCKSCHNTNYTKWDFYFCGANCLCTWLEGEAVYSIGVPCQACRDTGYNFGFEANGLCDMCNGKKRVKV